MAPRGLLSSPFLATRALLLVLLLSGPPAALAKDIPALVYHDITETRSNDAFAVSRAAFAEQLEYLRTEGYTPVSLALLDKVQRGEARLPEKPVLITFDDGLVSYATQARPLLERYGYPSVLSVVTGWLDGARVPADYRGRLLDWSALRALARANGVELVSHTHDLHHGLPSNPQGNEAPASITRRYDTGSGRYETEVAFRARIRSDLERTKARFVAELKQAPAGIAWPFGLYDEVLLEEATRLGMTWQLTLDRTPTRLETLPRIHRLTFHRYRNLREFADMVSLRELRREQIRFVEVEYDLLSPQDPTRFEQRLSQLLRRLELLRVGGVLIRPFSADGKRAYFPTSAMPLAGDTLNRVLHQLRSRLHLDHLYLRIPGEVLGKSSGQLADDLGRLNRFTGIVISGGDKASIEAFAGRLRYHQPALRVGMWDENLQIGGSAFLVREISGTQSPEVIEREVQKIIRRDSAAWFLVRRDGVGEAQLRDALVALRRAGAPHYGYGPDDFLAGRPRAGDIVSTLLAHTVVNHAD